ncbi:MAG: acetyl-CoA carboxylase carboxyl transferase subunit alpha [Candidatus Marinimicrobia bacterium]|nr:acetyl-CoA carboxylase carboxyl transferase subunit alpha [Candidatus Neomarinimicrobiota bacterium]|tara:strand:- start:5760 stop:6719 length:960 start_codon:yes stop_codon:yes gene_type:complete
MTTYYLQFEKPIQELDDKILELEALNKPNKKTIKQISHLVHERSKVISEIYSNLSRWQRVQLARHPNRPFALDYINYFSPKFLELHGDRYFMDDPAVVAGIGKFGDRRIAWIGQQKGRSTKENLKRNFGMMRPEGYRKALRIMKLAEKFEIPVITLIDTMGAYPGIGAEERGQGEAIASNLIQMASLKVPIIGVVIGEGASGGALGIGLCDRMLMMKNTWYSVISPEGCASILYRDAARAEDAAEALKPIPDDLIKIGICDKIIEEPDGGAHRNFKASADLLQNALIQALDELSNTDPESFLENRILKYDKLGIYQEES